MFLFDEFTFVQFKIIFIIIWLQIKNSRLATRNVIQHNNRAKEEILRYSNNIISWLGYHSNIIANKLWSDHYRRKIIFGLFEKCLYKKQRSNHFTFKLNIRIHRKGLPYPYHTQILTFMSSFTNELQFNLSHYL